MPTIGSESKEPGCFRAGCGAAFFLFAALLMLFVAVAAAVHG